MLLLGVLAAQAEAAPAAAGSYDLLETEILTGSQASVTFSSLNSTYGADYQHLQIRAVTRGTRSGAEDSNVYVQFNADSGANYNSHYLRGNGSAVESGAYTSSNNNGVFLYQGNTGATQTASSFAVNIIDILDPFEATKYTTVRNISGMTGALNRIFIHSGAWRNTSALTSITLDDTVGNFAQYSRFSLYGLKKAA